jgi:two-component system chemotaxis response regulator CheB
MIKILIVDDSALVRKVLSEIINQAPGMQVVGAAPDPLAARDMIRALDPDVLTLDV